MKLMRVVLSSITVLATPLLLLMFSIRLVISPLFLQIEYNMPYFPPDAFGFTKTDRLHYGRYAIDYLLNDAGIEYLGDLQLPEGGPLFNERELGHMVDVKNLVQLMLRVLPLIALGLIVIGLAAWRLKWLEEYWQSISWGGWLTVGLIIAILLVVALSFRALFTGFHLLFFEGDTWLFSYSDSLIRLFPLPFWRDGFILVGLLSAGFGALLGWRARRWSLEAESQGV